MAQQGTSTQAREVGFVTRAKQYLFSLEGLPSVHVNDIVQNEEGDRALVTGLERERVEAVLLDNISIRPGDRFMPGQTQSLFSFGDHLFGRIINALGDPLDEKSALHDRNAPLELDVEARSISKRVHIEDQFVTGVTLVDTLLPIGKGQRQLLYGPIRSGKNPFVRETIINQQNRDTVCIYAAIGKPSTFIRQFAHDIFNRGAEKYTVIVAASSEDPTPLITIAPSVAFSLAEYFSMQGRDVLLALDDLGTHAKYLREMALLQGRLPGRESYPGDIFYQHAQLMERSGAFTDGGTLTLLPMLETDVESYTDLIPTNLMASTDGHFSFSAARRAAGYFPSISEEESVTRVGRNTQSLVQKQLSTKVLSLLAEYREQEEYSRFGAQVSSRTEDILRKGKIVQEMLKQEAAVNIPYDVQVILLGLVFTSFFKERDVAFLQTWKETIIDTITENKKFQDIREKVSKDVQLDTFLQQLEPKVTILEQVCHE